MSRGYWAIIAGLVVLVTLTASLAYWRWKSRQEESLKTAPVVSERRVKEEEEIFPLEIIFPKDGAEITTPAVTIAGKTSPGADVAVNDVDLVAETSGNFSTTVALSEGENYMIIVASDASGNVREKELTVTYTADE